MKLYLLTSKLDRPTHDVAKGFVVCAENTKQARALASTMKGDESADTWLLPRFSNCREIGTKKARVILRDYNAG